jgi:hypothetical protein
LPITTELAVDAVVDFANAVVAGILVDEVTGVSFVVKTGMLHAKETAGRGDEGAVRARAAAAGAGICPRAECCIPGGGAAQQSQAYGT